MPSIIFQAPLSPTFTSPLKSSTERETGALRRREYNRLQPILRLCPDVLEYVFLLGAACEQNSRSARRTITSYSQTCHDWRVVTFCIKHLWCQLVDFETRSLEWNQEMLRRSDPIPVHISFQVKTSRFRQLTFQLDYLERFRSYSIVCPDTSWDFLLARLHRPAPNLETLRVIYNPNPILSNKNPVRLPPSIFEGHAPKLRRLEMTECIIDFDSPILTNLTVLHVVDLSLVDAPTASEWLHYLTLMPALTELSLEGAIASVWDRPSASVQSVSSHLGHNHSENEINLHLPWITDLQLDAGVEEVSAMIQALPMPTPCRWSLFCANSRPGSAVDSIIDTFNRGLRESFADDDPCPLSLVVCNTDVYLVSQAQFLAPSAPSVSLYINFHCPDLTAGTIIFPEVIAAIGESIAKVTVLEINVPSVHPSLISLLRNATRVQTLIRLTGSMTRTLLPELQVAHSISSSSAVALPALDNIVFGDADSMWRHNYQTFIEFIKWRAEQGAPVKNVYFTDCCVLEDRVRECRDLGVHVQGGRGSVRWWNL